jgi:hypothetical protein
MPAESLKARWVARLGALFCIAQGRVYQLAVYMLCITMFAIAVAA